jgi:hypothetical protein
MAHIQIIHPDGTILDSQQNKRNELGYTIQEVFTHQQKMLKEAHQFLKLTYVKEPDKKR